jgi:hypothetical protein
MCFGDKDGIGYEAKLQHPLGVYFCNATLFVCDTYNHKVKIMKGSGDTILSETPIETWFGVSTEKNPHVVDGSAVNARLNEPNGCWAKLSSTGEFMGLYIADTGNDCIRFANTEGLLTTLKITGIPDVKETASNCVGG